MKKGIAFISIILFLLLVSCQAMPTQAPQLTVTVIHDGKTDHFAAASGATIQQVLNDHSISLGTLDKVDPGVNELVSVGETITIIRVTETFDVEESTLAFDSQTVKNESLAVGQRLLIQAGVNGIQSNTYRVLSEDGVEKSRTIVKTEITKPAQPEIVMVGIQSPFKAVTIPGTLVYISSSSAWVMEANTGNRREVVNTGDLDGRIFSLSPDHNWLLFSRSGDKNDSTTINSLWVVNISDPVATAISLGVKNVVHYAEWVPTKYLTIAFSTVEPRSTAPGWQANNDLQVLNFNEQGKQLKLNKLIDDNPGGIYGWWGSSYSFSPDDSDIAYTRPDSIGLADSKSGSLTALSEFSAYQPQGDWAWVPGICWGSGDHSILYTVFPSANSSPNNVSFDLDAYLLNSGTMVTLQQDTGMFAYPSVSPADASGRYVVAYLSAILPDQSATSRYDLRVMDRDGSNMKKLYPEEGVQGLDPQKVVWSPITGEDTPSEIAFVAQGNLYFVDPNSGNIQQITGDGSISSIDWK